MSECDGALIYENTGYTNLFDLAVSLKHVAEKRGTEFYTDTTVREVVTDDDAVRRVRTRHRIIDANYVVVVAGWKAHDLLVDILEVP